MSLSVIIPTYNNLDFIDELFRSITSNPTQFEYEVLIGIDNCEKTKLYVEQREFPENFNFFFFLENVGPYKIKNTLTKISKFENIFFFDSDDIMMNGALEEINSKLEKYECVKPKFINFKDKDGKRNYEEGVGLYGEGVFGIKKDLFLSMNGFEGWRCAADSDFMGRLYKLKRKIHLTNSVLFHRRIHNRSLTKDPSTGYASKLRGDYFRISKNKNYFGPLPDLATSDYSFLDKNTHTWSSDYIVENDSIIDNVNDIKQKKQQLVNSVFNGTKNQSLIKQPKTIDYDIHKHKFIYSI